MPERLSDAAEPLPEYPEEVLLAALRARDEHDHARVTMLCDPESVRERFERICEIFQPVTIEQFAQRTGIAADRLEVSYERWVKGRAPSQLSQLRGLGVSAHAELVALGQQEVLTRWMMRDDHQLELVRRLRAHGRLVPPGLLATPPGIEYVVLGGVHEAPSLVHLLWRYVAHRGRPEEFRGPVRRTALARQPDGAWRLLAEDDHFLDSADGFATVMISDEAYADLFTEISEEQAGDSAASELPPTP
jgi:hypothetical protein